jgi:hypothetical protein
VGHRYLQAGLIGEVLQFPLPQPDPDAVGPAAIGGYSQKKKELVGDPRVKPVGMLQEPWGDGPIWEIARMTLPKFQVPRSGDWQDPASGTERRIDQHSTKAPRPFMLQ